jgi:protein-L-isoaspartate(D-aspartate) O-methyltransferase
MSQQAPDRPQAEDSRRVSPVLLAVVLGVVLAGGVIAIVFTRRSPASAPAPPVVEEAATEPETGGEEEAEATSPEPEEPAGPAYDITTRTSHPPLENEQAFVEWMLENSPETEEYLRAKWNRAQVAVRWNDIKNERVLEAFLRAPRQYFCRERNVAYAYEHMVLDIGYGQTISGPHLVARMTDFLNPDPDHRVLEIGTGSGYQSSVLAELSNYVYTIEIVPQLAEETDAIYKQWSAEYPQYQNIVRKEDDGYYGWEEYAPFDRIIVTCGIDHIPPDLLKQLKVGGVMVIPVGPPSGQTILKVTKTQDEEGNLVLEREDLYGGRIKEVFVPFTASDGTYHSRERDKITD